MKKILFVIAGIVLLCIVTCCQKENNENNESNENNENNENNEIVIEAPSIVSIEETINSSGDVVLEALFDNNSIMYFKYCHRTRQRLRIVSAIMVMEVAKDINIEEML